MSTGQEIDPTCIAVGGVGGSGTRLVAQLLRAVGVHLGDDLNEASDTLWFTLLFKRIEILRVEEAEFDHLVAILLSALRRGAPLTDTQQELVGTLAVQARPEHPADWLRERATSLLASAGRARITGGIGWKEPNTHVVIERLWKRLPQLRYVHVVRNGVDMAWSGNQNQLRLWGPQVLGEDGPATPGRSLAYWRCVHERMQWLREENPRRMYWLDYDALCRNPKAEGTRLCRFLGCDTALAAPVLARVRPRPPRSGVDLSVLDTADLAYVRSLGYRAEPATV